MGFSAVLIGFVIFSGMAISFGLGGGSVLSFVTTGAGLGASELELVGDSELIVKQVKGEYKVKDATMRELHSQVKRALEDFESWSIRHVRRERNAEADRLVNEALDA